MRKEQLGISRHWICIKRFMKNGKIQIELIQTILLMIA